MGVLVYGLTTCIFIVWVYIVGYHAVHDSMEMEFMQKAVEDGADEVTANKIWVTKIRPSLVKVFLKSWYIFYIQIKENYFSQVVKKQ